MKRQHVLKSGLITTLLLLTGALLTQISAQGRAYLKFGPGGEAIGLFNLLRDPSKCGAHWRVFSGAVTRTHIEKRKEDLQYQFTLNAAGRIRSFAFTLGVDEIPRSDIEDLIARERGIMVRACESGSTWRAEEIVRNE